MYREVSTMSDKRDNNLGAGVVGAVVGASVAAATIVLMDKDKRDKAIEKAKQVRDSVDEALNNAKSRAQEMVAKGSRQVKEKAEQVEKAAEKNGRKLVKE